MQVKNYVFTAVLILFLANLSASANTEPLSLGSLFTDNAVLQRDSRFPIWGWTTAEKEVKVEFLKQEYKTKANKDGYWQINLGPYPAGGPHEMSVISMNRKIKLNNLLIGDVYLASGQSNMEWPVSHSNDLEKELKDTDYKSVRLFAVPKVAKTNPQKKLLVPAAWQESNPESVKTFSAIGYFFARAIHQDQKVPIGIIQSAWTGTPINYWMPEGPMYSAMINPLIPYKFKAVLWYQGESDAFNPLIYERQFKQFIKDWREKWSNANLPFFYFQLPNFDPSTMGLTGESWAFLRDSQRKALEINDTAMIVTIDIGAPKTPHPKNKQEFAKRLVDLVKNKIYGQKDIPYSGPLYKSHKINQDKVTIEFDHVGKGLASKESQTIKGFTIAGVNEIFYDANAKIVGNTIVVSSPKVSRAAAVRYAWGGDPDCNLYNIDGLPASPFRTDSFERPASFTINRQGRPIQYRLPGKKK